MYPEIQARQLTDRVAQHVDRYGSYLGDAKTWIVANFGDAGLIAFGIGLAAVALLVVMQLAKIGFAVLKYMALPGVVLAFVGSLLMPYSFSNLLPVTVAACTLLLLYKG